ncbi:hypothetical protein LWI29_006076 [Acer saccharum]|uniref:Uncharacterized protein n=1 Tax=Acer saccharum TaxID=4024 RepID=A0AA39VQN2_ACESA|nr:hypothetical protein LWI29_006076 [Acer saccharum]
MMEIDKRGIKSPKTASISADIVMPQQLQGVEGVTGTEIDRENIKCKESVNEKCEELKGGTCKSTCMALIETGPVILESFTTKSADGVNVNGPAILDLGPVHYEPTATILTDGLTDNGLDHLSRQVENRITCKVIAKFHRFGDLRKVEKEVEKHPAIYGGKRNIEKVGKVHSSLHKKLRNEEKDKLVPVECELGSSSSAKVTNILVSPGEVEDIEATL